MRAINVLSLFDGISVGRAALKNAGVKINNYYSSEIDKHAIAVSKSNWPNIIQLGDIENWKQWDIELDKIDLILAGSPCQGFSYIGNGLAFDHPQSKLFFVFLDILDASRAEFLLENVPMKKEYEDTITALVETNPVTIDSQLIVAARRKRLYWSSWHIEPLIKDKGILLKDILQNNVKGYEISDTWQNRVLTSTDVDKGFTKINPRKAITMTAKQYSNWKGTLVKKNGVTRKLTPIECERLQGLPDGYTRVITDTQRYKALGNCWTLPVIEYILRQNYYA